MVAACHELPTRVPTSPARLAIVFEADQIRNGFRSWRRSANVIRLPAKPVLTSIVLATFEAEDWTGAYFKTLEEGDLVRDAGLARSLRRIRTRSKRDGLRRLLELNNSVPEDGG
ncbi:hypothetical protein NDN08_004484 [Rhodosorus marinus]|uniref:Uncharacterized protein n=1 Tax=Rhodosorus marinus TaxID=101924 RepID=A0AAV8UPG7_9RHOD|nr:hypothetical protein NDN08_004484 [Rhodosorus marinus]